MVVWIYSGIVTCHICNLCAHYRKNLKPQDIKREIVGTKRKFKFKIASLYILMCFYESLMTSERGLLGKIYRISNPS